MIVHQRTVDLGRANLVPAAKVDPIVVEQDPNLKLIDEFANQFEPKLAPVVLAFNNTPLAELCPNREAVLEYFGLKSLRGIPPALESRSPEMGKFPFTTLGIHAELALKALDSLPGASSLEEALGQAKASVEVIRMAGAAAINTDFERYFQNFTISRLVFDAPGQFTPDQETYLIPYTKHMIAAGYDGRLDILKLPSPSELVAIILKDSKFSDAILKTQPLANSEARTHPWDVEVQAIELSSKQQLVQLLLAEERGVLVERTTSPSDVLRIIRKVPLDVCHYENAGMIRSLLHRPAA